MKKSIIMCVLVFMMCLTFADTAKANTDATLYILGQEVTGDTASGDGWRFERAIDDDSYHKLYLTNANFVVDDSTITSKVDGQAIEMRSNLEIILSGNNTINMNATDISKILYYDAIDASKLVFSGSGSLNVKYKDITTNRAEFYPIYTSNGIEVKEGIKISIEGMTATNKTPDKSGDIYLSGLCGDDIIIHSNAQINISNFSFIDDSADGEIQIDCIKFERLTIEKNGKLNIEMGNIAANRVEFTGLGPYSDVVYIINDNAQISIKLSNISSNNSYCFGIPGASMTLGNNVNLSIDMGTVTGNGNQGALLVEKIVAGNYCNILAKASEPVGNNEEVNLINAGLVYDSIDLGKDSIIKCFGENFALATTSSTLTYPIYGGNNKDELKALTISKTTFNSKETLTAMYGDTPAKYAEIGNLLTINLNGNGGTVNKSSFTMHNGHAVGTLPTPTRTGYTFTGWYTAATGGTKVYSTTKLTKSMTLYAQWKKITYNITLNANGGNIGTTKLVVEYGNTLGTLPTPTRTGYTFTGWYTAKTGGTKVYSTTKPTKSMTLYAQWKIKTYTIKFDGNGGTVGVEKKWVDHGNAMNFMPTPKRDGYTFTGWYTAATGGNKVYSTTKVTKNMTLYAQWKKK